jgi:hypothetical protein
MKFKKLKHSIYSITNTLSGVVFFKDFKPNKYQLCALCCKKFNNWNPVEFHQEMKNYVIVQKIEIYKHCL